MPRWLAIGRYLVLLTCTIIATIAISSEAIPFPKAVVGASIIALSFLIGLRMRRAIGIAFGLRFKELSWSTALITSTSATFVLDIYCLHIDFRKTLLVLTCELSIFYLYGKVTCLAMHCCEWMDSLKMRVRLPILEISLSLSSLLGSAFMFYLTHLASSSILLLILSHLGLRIISRIGRLGLAKMFQADIAFLAVGAVACSTLR